MWRRDAKSGEVSRRASSMDRTELNNTGDGRDNYGGWRQAERLRRGDGQIGQWPSWHEQTRTRRRGLRRIVGAAPERGMAVGLAQHSHSPGHSASYGAIVRAFVVTCLFLGDSAVVVSRANHNPSVGWFSIIDCIGLCPAESRTDIRIFVRRSNQSSDCLSAECRIEL